MAIWRINRAVALLAMAGAIVAVQSASAQTAGAPGAGDPYYPLAGNGGYEVDHYGLHLKARPKVDRVKATATINATATQSLSSFNLDFRGLRVSSATVDGTRAAVVRRGGEMTVTPAQPIAFGAHFVGVVAYRGRPRPIGGVGWIRTHDGTAVFSEPTGSPSWFPCNDSPSDKASYSFTVTVPRRYRAIANGQLDPVERRRGTATFAWHETRPMATYLATVTVGHFRIKPSTVDGVPAWTAVAPGQGEGWGRNLLFHPAQMGGPAPLRQRDHPAVHRSGPGDGRRPPRAFLRPLAVRAAQADWLVALSARTYR